jgi:hypothetical protein
MRRPLVGWRDGTLQIRSLRVSDLMSCLVLLVSGCRDKPIEAGPIGGGIHLARVRVRVLAIGNGKDFGVDAVVAHCNHSSINLCFVSDCRLWSPTVAALRLDLTLFILVVRLPPMDHLQSGHQQVMIPTERCYGR